MGTSEEEIKRVLEENRGLKAYIQSMNNECLELNAVLFDEANKMVASARAKQHNAEKKAKEKLQENELLKAQVAELKAVIADFPAPVSPIVPNSNDGSFRSPVQKSINKKSSLSRLTSRRSKQLQSQQSIPQLYKKSCENLSLLIESSPGSILTTVSRSTLLDALLAEDTDASELNSDLYQEFLNWIKSGCSLQLPPTFQLDCCDQPVINESSPAALDKKRVLIVRIPEATTNDQSDSEWTGVIKSDSYFRIRRTPRIDSYSTASTISIASHTTGQAFMHRLYDEDVRYCLDFKDERLKYAIYSALPEFAMEISPLSRPQRVSGDSSPTSTTEFCPLLPPLEPAYRLTVKDPWTGDDCLAEHLVADISSEARNRIVATVNLFQYLNFIRRGSINLGSAKRDRSGSVSTRSLESLSSGSGLSQGDQYATAKQFAKIQRFRLMMSFARLGFGLPEFE